MKIFMNGWVGAGMVLGALAMAPPVRAEKFIAHCLVGTGGGYAMSASSFSHLSLHEAIQAADIDGDGFIDLVVLANGLLDGCGNNGYAPGCSVGANHYLFSSGAGKESPNVRGGTMGDPYGEYYVGSDLAWYRNDGYGNFSLYFITPKQLGIESPANVYEGRSLEVADLGEGRPDIVVCANYNTAWAPDLGLGAGRVSWFENNAPSLFSNGGIEYIQHDVISVAGGNFPGPAGINFLALKPAKATLGDMDGDTKKDLVVLNYEGGGISDSSLYWFKNTGSGATKFNTTVGNVHAVILAGTGQPYHEGGGSALAVSDVDGDGRMDFVLGQNSGARDLLLLRQNGGGQFSRELLKSNHYVSNSVAVEDLFGDACKEIVAGGKKADIASFPDIQSPLAVFSANNYPACTTWIETVLPGADDTGHVWDIRFADLNNDGRQDILAFWINDSYHAAASLPSGAYSVTYAWINGGGPTDWPPPLALAEPASPPGEETQNGGGLAIADFDRDGDVDVVRAHIETDLVHFENTWNTERHFKIETMAQKNETKQKVTSFHSTNPNRSVGAVIGQKVESQ